MTKKRPSEILAVKMEIFSEKPHSFRKFILVRKKVFRTFWSKLLKKWSFGNFCLKNIEFFCQLAWKNRKFSENCLEKLIFFTRIQDPQISNQIDAAALVFRVSLVIRHKFQFQITPKI